MYEACLFQHAQNTFTKCWNFHLLVFGIAIPGCSPELGCHQQWRDFRTSCAFSYPVLITFVVLLHQLSFYIKAEYLAQLQSCLLDKVNSRSEFGGQDVSPSCCLLSLS